MTYNALNAWERGGNGPNGKPSLTIEEAAATLTRSGLSWSAPGQATSVTYAYRASAPSTMPEDTGGFERLSSQQITYVEEALRLWSTFANITFVRSGSGMTGDGAYSNTATILFGNYTSGGGDAAAFAYYPGSRSANSVAGDVWFDGTLRSNDFPTNQNDFGFLTILHEIGHAIGLDHPSGYDVDDGHGNVTYESNANYFEDSLQYSIMSYFDMSDTGGSAGNSAAPGGPMIDDIAAIQRLYGANMNSYTGDTVYGNPYNGVTYVPAYLKGNGSGHTTWGSIWDAGGIDTLDFSRSYIIPSPQLIDLREGSFSNVDGGTGNLSIALGVTIENAIGNDAGDVIIGNVVANQLTGNDGNDTLYGNGGNDRIYGGNGFDKLTGGIGADMLVGGAGEDWALYETAATGISVDLANNNVVGTGDAAGDTFDSISGIVGSAFGDSIYGDSEGNDLQGKGGDDFLSGRAGDDFLSGGAGNDYLNGSAGRDALWGDDGFDYAVYSLSSGGLTIDLQFSLANSGDGLGDIFSSVEGIIGSTFADNLRGDQNANWLWGNGGADYLFGRAGDDVLVGSDDADTLVGEEGLDILYGNEGVDYLYGGAGGDFLNGGNGFDYALYAFSSGSIVADLQFAQSQNVGESVGDVYAGIEGITGSDFGDSIRGDAGANWLWGNGGDDYLYGRDGNDALVGGRGHDLLSGGSGSDQFHFGAGDGQDIIFDMQSGYGEGDTIWLSSALGVSSYDDVQARALQHGSDVFIQFEQGVSLTIANTDKFSLAADDFIFI